MMTLTRDQARQEIKARWRDIITEYTDKAKDRVNGEDSYICPICGHGKGGDGLTRNPRSKDGNGLKCFGCDFSGDILDLIQQHTGADYNTALSEAAGYLGIEIEPFRTDPGQDFNASKENKPEIGPNSQVNTGEHKTPTDAEKTPGQGQNEAGALSSTGTSGPDFTAYYRECADRITDPAAAAYITGRGISIETAKKYWIGYDPKADPAKAPGATGNAYRPHPAPRLIIPVTPGHYIGRRIDGGQDYKKMNNSGAQIGIFNANEGLRPAADQDQGRPVFIVEGAIDALSIIEAGAEAVAINSTSNVNFLLETIDQTGARGPFILALDTDQAGEKATEKLKEGLEDREIPYITADINGDQNDPNDALIKDRARFEADIKKAQEEAKTAPAKRLPGLLSYEDAVHIFETADDSILTMKSFPNFSKVAKIKLHDTIALAADTGAGKSSLTLNFINDLRRTHDILYFNLEMTKIQVLQRLVAIESGIEIDSIEKYRRDPEIAKIVNITLKQMLPGDNGFHTLQVLQEDEAHTLDQIRGVIERSTKDRPDWKEPLIVFIDHGLLISAAGSSNYEKYTELAKSLRRISLKHNIILFVLLQQNRAGKASEDERPRNSSLKESGEWENSTTHVVFLWYDPTARKKKLIITKNRNGDNGEFALDYFKRTQRYGEADQGAAGSDTAEGPAKSQKMTRRERQRQRLENAYKDAYILAFGNPTLKDIAEAADVTTSTIKSWIKEYGGCFIDGQQVDPAGIDTKVELTGFIKITPADNAPEEITGEAQDQPIKRF